MKFVHVMSLVSGSSASGWSTCCHFFARDLESDCHLFTAKRVVNYFRALFKCRPPRLIVLRCPVSNFSPHFLPAHKIAVVTKDELLVTKANLINF